MADGASFNCLLATVAATLTQKGFQRSGNTFWSSSPGSWALIQFQRSTKSSAQQTTFTVNLGIASKALLKFLGKPERVPTIDECHWRQRIGFVLPDAADRWWQLMPDANAASVAGEVIKALTQFALPAIESHSSDASLRDTWISGRAPGLTEIDRLRFLSALLKIEGLDAESAIIAGSLEVASHGRPTAGVARMHLKKLRLRNRGV